MRYRAVFEFEGDSCPAVGARDGWLGGKLVSVDFDGDDPIVPLSALDEIEQAHLNDTDRHFTRECHTCDAIRAAREGAGK